MAYSSYRALSVRTSIRFLLTAAMLVGVGNSHARAEHDDDRQPGVVVGTPLPGYRGIWHGQEPTKDQYSYKYSGGLATYTAKHIPMAVYSPEANRTFFVYGGTKAPVGNEGGPRDRLIAAVGAYDHTTGKVIRPTLVHDKNTFDPHDNPSIALDDQGHVWVFISGRGRGRAGWIYRSVEPHDIAQFRLVDTGEYTYPQPWFQTDRGFLFLFTKYLGGRQLFFKTSPDGEQWGEDQQLAAFGGHYQLSWIDGDRIATAFNWHPKGTVNNRTNMYYLETRDGGKTWQNAAGEEVELPLTTVDNKALVRDYHAEGKRAYVNDLKFDAQGNPVLQYVVTDGWAPGPESDPRVWVVARHTDAGWEFNEITTSDHNYDCGMLDLTDDRWRLIGATEVGPQPYHTGGEVAVWDSTDHGKTWTKLRDLTADSQYNHGYVRPVLHGNDAFFAYWSDGDPSAPSPCRLYFCNRDATQIFQLPEVMDTDTQEPIAVPLP